MESLIRAIAADPTATDAYLIYADALQERGDPRGELIALQHWAALDPDRREIARRADEFLFAHRVEFLGGLLVYPARHFELDWHMGFLQRVRMTFEKPGDARDALQALIDLRSAIFLRHLEIELVDAAPERRGPGRAKARPRRALREHYRGLAEMLIEAARPSTLRELVLGKPGEIALPDALYTVFPGLARAPGVLLDELRGAMARHGRLVPKFDAARLPPLELREPASAQEAAPGPRAPVQGSELAADGRNPLDAAGLVRALEAELARKQALGVVEKLRLLCTRASLDAFALELARQWQEMGEPSSRRWGFTLMGLIGGERCVDFIGSNLAEWSHQRAVQGLDLLEQIAGDAAAHEVYALAALPANPLARREHAWSVFDRMAARRGLTRESLIDRIAPARASGSSLPRVLAAQTRRLYDLMISGHRLSAADFQRYVSRRPLRAPLAARVLWGRYRGRHRLIGTFMSSTDCSLYDMDDASVELSPEDNVGVVHPAELADQAGILSQWRVRCAERHVAPLFEQLERPVYTLAEAERGAKEVRRFARRRVGFRTVARALESRDWRPHERNSGGIGSFSKYFARDDITIVAELGRKGNSIETAWPARDGWQRAKRALDTLHPVTVSELLYDLELAHTREPRPAAAADSDDA